MLYNTFDDTIMEPIGWLFEVLSGVLYLPFQFNEDTIIAGLIVMSGMSSVTSTGWKIILLHFGSTSSATADLGRVG